VNGSELSGLENEGVEWIFGVPGEESSNPCARHEQAAAFMAAVHGGLTGRPSVCLATLDPGALNLTTGAAFAQLGAMPMVMITGQKGVLSRKQARFHVVDVVSTMAPLTKLAQQIVSPATIPSTVREAFRLAQQERPGPAQSLVP
jgi:acetolactate synthase I/II/III large subunit